ncbi:hypothetical protein FKM82_023675 [Ascaphus truei]
MYINYQMGAFKMLLLSFLMYKMLGYSCQLNAYFRHVKSPVLGWIRLRNDQLQNKWGLCSEKCKSNFNTAKAYNTFHETCRPFQC